MVTPGEGAEGGGWPFACAAGTWCAYAATITLAGEMRLWRGGATHDSWANANGLKPETSPTHYSDARIGQRHGPCATSSFHILICPNHRTLCARPAASMLTR